MARYTVELRTIVDSGFNIFDFPYSFYDDTKKAEFQQRFIDHFYFREIGAETVGRFKHYLADTFHLKLPYYNELFRTALIEYNRTENYNILETTSRTTQNNNSLTGNTANNGVTSENGTSGSTINRTSDVVQTGEHTNTLDSTTDHLEDQTFTKNDSITEKNDTTKTTTHDTDNKHVESDTPSGLLAMTDIKSNVYASKAIIDDNTDKVTDTDKATGSKTGESTEQTDREVKDIVHAVSTDSSTNTNDENTRETASGNTSNSSSFNSNVNQTQSQTGQETEAFSRTMKGSYGVITEADMLQKSLDLQARITNIELKFFDECEECFMQIFNF